MGMDRELFLFFFSIFTFFNDPSGDVDASRVRVTLEETKNFSKNQKKYSVGGLIELREWTYIFSNYMICACCRHVLPRIRGWV